MKVENASKKIKKRTPTEWKSKMKILVKSGKGSHLFLGQYCGISRYDFYSFLPFSLGFNSKKRFQKKKKQAVGDSANKSSLFKFKGGFTEEN